MTLQTDTSMITDRAPISPVVKAITPVSTSSSRADVQELQAQNVPSYKKEICALNQKDKTLIGGACRAMKGTRSTELWKRLPTEE
jgi:hypothetical protein